VVHAVAAQPPSRTEQSGTDLVEEGVGGDMGASKQRQRVASPPATFACSSPPQLSLRACSDDTLTGLHASYRLHQLPAFFPSVYFRCAYCIYSLARACAVASVGWLGAWWCIDIIADT